MLSASCNISTAVVSRPVRRTHPCQFLLCYRYHNSETKENEEDIFSLVHVHFNSEVLIYFYFILYLSINLFKGLPKLPTPAEQYYLESPELSPMETPMRDLRLGLCHWGSMLIMASTHITAPE